MGLGDDPYQAPGRPEPDQDGLWFARIPWSQRDGVVYTVSYLIDPVGRTVTVVLIGDLPCDPPATEW